MASFLRYIRNMGVARGVMNWYVNEQKKGGSITPPGTSSPVYIRPGTTDADVFREVFLYQDYRVDIDPPATILDIGANNGFSSVYFSNRYPGATILAVEPDPGNFRSLLNNITGYPKIQALQAAAWHSASKLSIKDPGSPEWTRQVEQDGSGDVEGITVGSMIRKLDTDRVGLVKIDIEGSEKHLFESNTEWLGQVDHILIELHDRMVPGCSRNFFDALAGYQYEMQTLAGTILVKLN